MKIKLKIVTLLAAVFLFSNLFTGLSWAASGNVYLSPSSASVEVGNSTTLALRIDPGTSINAVQATVNYDPSALQYLSNSLGVFSTCVQDSGGGGTVTLSCAMLGSSTSSDSLIADISFKALDSSGSTSLNISGANAADNGSYTNPSNSGATINFTAPPSSNSGNSSSGGGSSAKHSSSNESTNTPASTSSNSNQTTQASPTTTVQPTLPKNVTIKVPSMDSQFNGAKINFKVSTASTLYMLYGTSKDNLNQSTKQLDTNGSGYIDLTGILTPGTTYYYRIVDLVDGTKVAESSTKSLTTKGYTVKVTVLDSHYHPVAGKQVVLHSNPQYVSTNSSGVAIFTDVAPGLHHVEYTDFGKVYSQIVYVTNSMFTKNGNEVALPQTDAVVLSSLVQTSSSSTLTVILVIILLAILGSMLGIKQLMLERLKSAKTHSIPKLKNRIKKPKAA